jgi:hypothetical protein
MAECSLQKIFQKREAMRNAMRRAVIQRLLVRSKEPLFRYVL